MKDNIKRIILENVSVLMDKKFDEIILRRIGNITYHISSTKKKKDEQIKNSNPKKRIVK